LYVTRALAQGADSPALTMSVLLISTYDLGRQPFGLASPAAWLVRAGFAVTTRDLSREPFDEADVQRATLVAFYLPMHTATRLALPVIERVRAQNPSATICAYGLYAPLSREILRARGVTVILGPEAEQHLVEVASHAATRDPSPPELQLSGAGRPHVPRLAFVTPDRRTLPPLTRYATLQMPDGGRRVAGSTDATRGCKHRCRHCPIVPIYDGQFRVVPVDVVMADVGQQVASGAEHITFGDPDFFNGPTHASRIVESLHARYPAVTYDATIKVEHLLKHRDLLPLLAGTGCIFVTSAVESVDDHVLEKLEKGHTRADFILAAGLCRDAGLVMAPTFVAFTPWTTSAGYRDLLQTVADLELVEHVAPVQWGLRLLITEGSRLCELDDIRNTIRAFDATTLTYPWTHEDPAVDRLQADIMRLVGVRRSRSRSEIFEDVSQLAGLGCSASSAVPRAARSTVPYLDEPWYC
jgi:radical SAM superfamily enzyme YgiQ (UPF0313 family)